MARRNSWNSVRQLIGCTRNSNNPCATFHLHVHHPNPKLFQSFSSSSETLTPSIPISGPLSLYQPTLSRMPEWVLKEDLPSFPSDPKNIVVVKTAKGIDRTLEKIEDGSKQAVMFFTFPSCPPVCRWINPIFGELCAQYPHVKFYKIWCHTAELQHFVWKHKCNVYTWPSFHFFQYGTKVHQIEGAIVKDLKETLAELYGQKNSSETETVKRKKRTTEKLKANVDENSEGVVGGKKVRGSKKCSQQGGRLAEAVESSISEVMKAVQSLTGAESNSKLQRLGEDLVAYIDEIESEREQKHEERRTSQQLDTQAKKDENV